MGSRKNILKTLCIPEYPWSSDDDDTPTDSTPDPRPAPAPQLRPGGEQAMPTTSSPAVSGSSERELFLSFLSLPSNRSGTSGSTNNRSDHLSLAYLPRSPHTPAPELRERAGGCDDSHIRRVLAFKQLTKNMGMGHNSGLGRYTRRQFPRARGNAMPGSVVPAEIISASNMRTGNRRPERRPYTNSRPGMGTDRVGQAASNINEPSPHRRRRTNSMEVNNNSEDEADELASTMSRPRYFAPLFATSTPEPAIDIDTDMPTISSNNTSGAGVSLEEDVVEILDSPAAVDLDLIVPVPVPAMPKRVRVKPATTTNDPNMPSTSAADQVDAPQTETDKGVKKNTRDSSDDKPSEVVTVKDFNQSLLRLLECPVCLEWMEPPMSQCRRGHLVCCRCRARLASCPVCRTTFSSVRNRAMEGVAELLRYPCRHGCGREVRLRRRTPHESSCVARLFTCPTPLCDNKEPMLRSMLAEHFSEQHTNMLKVGSRQRFGIKVNVETHETWLLLALDELFLLKVDVDVRTWGVVVYVAFIGPKCNAEDYAYEVNIDGQHNGRKLKYRRCTHSDLESSSLNVSRQDCFHLTLDQALNFIRFKNRHFDAEKYLEFDVELSKVDPPPSRDDSDS